MVVFPYLAETAPPAAILFAEFVTRRYGLPEICFGSTHPPIGVSFL
jgi:hypothetical protein